MFGKSTGGRKRGAALAVTLALFVALGCVAASAEPIAELAEPIAELPVLLTSVGQSADVEMVRVMFEKNNMAPTLEKLATSGDIADNKTLVLAVGGSAKGLGAAGIDAEQELRRAEELIKAADDQGLVIIVMHVGGSARRGDLSDKFIPLCFEYADYAIVVEEGDGDAMMKNLAAEKGIPFTYTGSMAGSVAPLAAAFVS